VTADNRRRASAPRARRACRRAPAGRFLAGFRARVRRGRDQVPDRRGEAFAIFTTIFVRPALELGPSVTRIARHLGVVGGLLARPARPAGLRTVENRS